MRPWLCNLLSLFCLVAAAELFAERLWVEVRSPHFTVVSNASRQQAVRVAQEFEQIREAARRVLPKMSLDPGQPIVILAVRNEADLRQLIPEYWEQRGRARPAGLFLRGPERHYVALRLDVGGQRPFQTVYHEYLHLLVTLNLPQAPLWVNEGLAEFYANSAFKEGEVVFGLPSEAHVRLLRRRGPMPLRELLQVDEKSPYYNHSHKVSVFYSQSWALVHYLLTRDWEAPESVLDRFLRLLAEDSNPDEALRSLGDLDALEQSLRRYVSQDDFYVFRYPEAITVPTRDFGVRDLSDAEAAAVRGSFLVSNDRLAEAELLISRAIADDPDLPLAHESLGYLRYVTGKQADARAAFERAARLGSQSYLSHYFLGFLSLEAADTPEEEARVEKNLRDAIRLRPNFPYAYTALATLLLRHDESHEEALSLARQADRLEPHNPKLLQTLAYALGRSGQLEEADRVLGEMHVWAASESDLALASRVEDSLTEIREYWRRKREYDRQVEAMQREGQMTSLARSSWRTREVAGTVRAVSCSAPASMEILLETSGGQLELVSHNFSVVQFFFAGSRPGGDFHPCHGLKGREVLASYQPDRQESYNRLVSVRVQD